MSSPAFRSTISRYFNGACFSTKDGLVSVIMPSYPFRKNARKVIDEYEKELMLESKGIPVRIEVLPYTGSNPGVLEMKKALSLLQKDIAFACVHGSLATGEEVTYSDFDGLIVIKDDVFSNEKRLINAAEKINQTRKIMLRMDPLQHHGWFVLKESDFGHYPETFLPSDVLKESKSLLSDTKESLILYADSNIDYYYPLKELCRSLRKKTHPNSQPRTLYQLKSFLSEFMMLPALYVQARDRRGVFKKYSFALAAVDFKKEDWSIIEEVSLMRDRWPLRMSDFHRGLFSKTSYFWTQYRKRFGPGIPREIKSQLDEKFYERIATLANLSEVYVFTLDR
ncbi:MAG TPA: nucleotidyltransferase domain-containing protein [Bacteroidia bacterium]|nr:nucleotidyltransferase domain-containing protein [Bacteroidia bacterium]